MARRLTRDEQQRILDAYEAYDPDVGNTIDDLLAELEISRQTLYGVLVRHGVEPKTRRPSPDAIKRRLVSAREPDSVQLTSDLLDVMSGAALNRLFQRLSELERDVARLERENAQLRDLLKAAQDG